MILQVTDEALLEQSGGDYRDVGERARACDTQILASRAGHFVETVLEFNPDATEQLDLMDKHLICVDNLGAKARENLEVLTEQLHEACMALTRLFEGSGPEGLDVILTGMPGFVARLNPDAQESGALSHLLEYVPGLYTPIKRYFLGFEASRTQGETLVRAIDYTLARQKKSAGLAVQLMESLERLSLSLVQAIRLGQLMDQTLCEALFYEVPRDDPRERFISGPLLFRLRRRLAALDLQVALNRRYLVTMEMLVQNSRELAYGLYHARAAIIGAFNRGAELAPVLTHRRMVKGPLAQNTVGADDETDDYAATPGLGALKKDLARIVSHEMALKNFLDTGVTVLAQAMDRLNQLRRRTDEAFVSLKVSGGSVLVDEMVDRDGRALGGDAEYTDRVPDTAGMR